MEKKSDLALAGLGLSILGVVLSWIPLTHTLSFVMGIFAVIAGMVAIYKKINIKVAIVAIIIGALVIYFNYSGKASNVENMKYEFDGIEYTIEDGIADGTAGILEKYLDVTIGELVVEDGLVTTTKLPVKLTNKSSETKTFSVEIEAVNLSGDRITTDTVIATSLSAGQGQDLTAFEYVTEDTQEQLKDATFKVLRATEY